MNRKLKAAALLIVIGALVIIIGNDGSRLLAQTAENKGDGKDKSGLITDWLNDFEDCEDWRADATCPLGETKIRKYEGKPNPMKDGKPVNDKGEAGDFPDTSTEEEGGIVHQNKYVIGVKSYFADRDRKSVV